jgi:16S rRNA processing protein RimM
MSRDGLIVIGRVQKPFGVRGEIRIQAYTETFEAFKKSEWLEIKEIRMTIKQIRIQKGSVFVLFEGIDAPEEAAKLSGQLVHTLAQNLPPKEEDEYYWYELIGMDVFTNSGQYLGRVNEIIPTGANDVIVVTGDYGEILLPFIDQVVLETDLAGKRMLVDPMEGMIPNA